MTAISLDLAGGRFALETAKLSDDDKALLYLSIVMPPASVSSDAAPSRPCSCFLCGDVGHTANVCRRLLPNLAALQRKSDRDVQKVVAMVTAEKQLVRDEFGFLVPGTFLPDDKNHTDGHFCQNCAELGHSAVRCDRPQLYACATFMHAGTPVMADPNQEFNHWFRGGAHG